MKKFIIRGWLEDYSGEVCNFCVTVKSESLVAAQSKVYDAWSTMFPQSMIHFRGGAR